MTESAANIVSSLYSVAFQSHYFKRTIIMAMFIALMYT